MTNDYRIILPLMFAVVISLLTSQLLQRDSVYLMGLARKGIRLQRGRDVELLQSVSVADVMQTEFLTLDERTSLAEAARTLVGTRHHGLCVLDIQGNLAGILTVQDVDRVMAEGGAHQPVGAVCTRDLLVAYPDETIGTVLRRMSVRDIGRLPVVTPGDPRRLVGVLRRSDVMRAYDLALSRRAALRHQAHQVRLGAVRGEDASIIQVTVEVGAPCAGRPMHAIPWPHASLIASLRRGGRLLIPHGDTVVQAGDVLVAVAEGAEQDAVRDLCRAAEPTADMPGHTEGPV